jgi:3-oxoadipate CoA-transferase, beta subunit
MDLAIGAKHVFVVMTLFGKDGSPKLVPKCTYPLTGVGCVSRVYTDYGVFELTDHGVVAGETYGMSRDDLAERLKITFQAAEAESAHGSP